MVERRKARVPPLRDAGAPRKRPGPPRDISAFMRVLCHAAGPPDAAASGRLSALRPPLIGVDKVSNPGAMRRGNEMCCAGLFDIVKKECGHAHAFAGTIWRVATRKGDIASLHL